MRQAYLDNIRWFTVLLVLLFHVFYYYNAYFLGTGVGCFSAFQPQDAILYIMYPWLMLLLFLVAGISSRFALDKYSPKEFFRARTRKLLIPSTLGLFVFQWIAGYFGIHAMQLRMEQTLMPENLSLLVKYIICSVSGVGVLWFIQLLWLFSLILLLINLVDKGRTNTSVSIRLSSFLSKDSKWNKTLISVSIVVFGFLLLWTSEQTIMNFTDFRSGASLFNLYRPVVYLVVFLLGYFFFSHTIVMDLVEKMRWPMLICSILGAGLITFFTFGEDANSPAYLRSWYNNLYAWIVILAVLGCFRHWFNSTSPISSWLSRSSYGIYVMQNLIVYPAAYLLFYYSFLPPWAIYLCLALVSFTLCPLSYELFRHIPVARYFLFGIRKK